jgi:hypothetical protein
MPRSLRPRQVAASVPIPDGLTRIGLVVRSAAAPTALFIHRGVSREYDAVGPVRHVCRGNRLIRIEMDG